ncbi:hypothetical protein BCV69DRAFT_243445 [Microstroma glucosiphilum]|uniref:EF-hand domain-containing protein n=1 Tax=Pseudomicrostroma glucosiphilum TaxID=1684307 RepID=A0A316UI42_9BASI|nr:hypothetical protein BCV69DRAFT_243445 [Pseudomicrostroma glucosiphilum]PWN23991.1 hypothetical protein BCV69DRAFT_243445 [Pseudomicrostroma glucosiphilum]
MSIPRWLAYVLPVTALLWVPGIVALAAYDARPANNFARPTVWNTGTFWWSCWLSCIWVGGFVCRAVAGFFPRLFKRFLGPTSITYHYGVRRIPDYLIACEGYLAIVFQSIFVYALWLTLIWDHYQTPTTTASNSAANPLEGSLNNSNSTITYISTNDATGTDSTTELLVTISRFFFGVMLCSVLLLLFKLGIHLIAFSFHQVTYSQRVALSQFQIAVLATLWRQTRQLGRRGTPNLSRANSQTKGSATPNLTDWTPGQKKRRRDTYTVLGTAAIGLVADQYHADEDAAEHIVLNAFYSAGETRKFAHRLFQALSRPDPTDPSAPWLLSTEDFAGFFPDPTTASAAFETLDKDSNGSITHEEMESSCLEMRHARITLIDSMHDVDSAVNSLDKAFMSFYVLLAAVLIAAMLSTTFANLVTSLSAVVLGLSWLFSASAAETFGAIVLLIIKHPYDTGDSVDVSDVCGANLVSYTVAEMYLLSTTFRDSQGRYVQISNAQLAQKAIINHRRSGSCSEQFSIDLAYSTSLSQLEALRAKMVSWLEGQGRDFLPGLNITITSLGDQTKMTVAAGIRYKSNWQDPDLKARRRNRWICAFKAFLAELHIFGPAGDPASGGPVTKVAMVEPPSPATQSGPAKGGDVDEGGRGDATSDPAEYILMDEKKPGPADVAGVYPVEGLSSGVSTPSQSFASRPMPDAMPGMPSVRQRSQGHDAPDAGRMA